MKFKATFSSVGVQWLERFAPIFDKLGKELSVLFTPNSIHLVQNHAESGGIEIHADLLKDEVFDACLLQSANDNKIGVRLEPARQDSYPPRASHPRRTRKRRSDGGNCVSETQTSNQPAGRPAQHLS